MMWHAKNPFDVTKAVDFTDTEIRDTWVDWHGKATHQLISPGSRIATFLTGGKGGGRTHSLRYHSYPLQCLRHREDVANAMKRDGYVGVYFRCSGLNAFRFDGKKQTADTWTAVFAYYMDVWLGRSVLRVVEEHCGLQGVSVGRQELRDFIAAIDALFGRSLGVAGSDSIADLGAAFDSRQRQIDHAVNNAGLTHQLAIDIDVSPGYLVQGVPRLAAAKLAPFRGIAFVYLMDEYENFTKTQQRYVNTLIREREIPTGFVIGGRRYGIRTHETLNAREINKIGSEYEVVELEDIYRQDKAQYGHFCRDIVRQRLKYCGPTVQWRSALSSHFACPDGSLEDRAIRHVEDRQRVGNPVWMKRLHSHLRIAGIEPATIVPHLQFADSPLHEKFAIFLFYRGWASGRPLADSAQEAHDNTDALLQGVEGGGKIHTTYRHYRFDLYAQLLIDLGKHVEYYGLSDFVLMSGYLPRNLLVVLKQVVRWSMFLGDDPFGGSEISLTAQRRGVRDAGQWFLMDAKGLGPLGESTERAILRLGSLFRHMRYSDRPVEVSCSTFETDRQGLSDRALETLDSAIANSLLLKVAKGRRERNTGVLRHKYQLHPMLAPLFGLSLGRRGTARFSAALLNAVLDPGVDERSFGHERRKVLARLRVPFGGGPPGQTRLGLGRG